MQWGVGHRRPGPARHSRSNLKCLVRWGEGCSLQQEQVIPPAFLPSPPMPGPQYSLLLLQLVGGCELIEQLPVHLHEGLEHIVDQRYNGSWQGQGRGMRR